MRIALISDAWAPQVNGVVRTLGMTVTQLRAAGHEVITVTPDRFRTVPCPSYPEIRLAIAPARRLARMLAGFDPDAVHIATEGPLGWAARRWCQRSDKAFTTSFHTRFPDYVAMRTKLPADWVWPVIRRFHAPAARIFAATDALEQELAGRRLAHTHRWSRGVDLDLFSPGNPKLPALADAEGPVQLYVGRVAIEKNIEAFLDAAVSGTKVVVGDGPARVELARRYPHVRFLGALHGAELASVYASADVFVFPSRTDTFGLVMLEALASGVPVAAYPVPGPLDVIGSEGRGTRGEQPQPIGAIDSDLDRAIGLALSADRQCCVAEAQLYSWEACTQAFVAGLAPRRRSSVTETSLH